MNLSVTNIIINYFLLHEDVHIIKNKDLEKLSKEIENNFNVKVNVSKEDIRLFVNLCEDFLHFDQDENICQDGITNYLESLEPVCEWFGISDWKYSQKYYNFLKNYNIGT